MWANSFFVVVVVVISKDDFIIPFRWQKRSLQSDYFERQDQYKTGVWFEFYRKKRIQVYKEISFGLDANDYPVFLLSLGLSDIENAIQNVNVKLTEGQSIHSDVYIETGFWESKSIKSKQNEHMTIWFMPFFILTLELQKQSFWLLWHFF